MILVYDGVELHCRVAWTTWHENRAMNDIMLITTHEGRNYRFAIPCGGNKFVNSMYPPLKYIERMGIRAKVFVDIYPFRREQDFMPET